MREMLGHEYDAFLAAYSKPTRRGLRLNLLKCDKSHIRDLGPLTPVPWCKEGYEYLQEVRPAKSILYNAGLFYIQEPSAMSPAAILRPRPGQRVLDICAAPGGKSVQLATYMRSGEEQFPSHGGVLVSNDISPSRSRALVKNLEMAGVTNAVVLTEKPNRLASRFAEYFDCILVDAPCSGEGMFRRDPDAAKAYTANKPESCAAMQQDILRHVAQMLRPGGRLVYSTCTFNPLENEGTVSSFLAAHPEYELLPIDHAGLGLCPGQGKWVTGVDAEIASALKHTARIWPHNSPGEGHFVALMTKAKTGTETGTGTGSDNYGLSTARELSAKVNHDRLPGEFIAFCEQNLHTSGFSDPNLVIHQHGNSLFLTPENLDLSGLRVARSGWLLGECTKGRFVPSQAMAMGITKQQARYAVELPESDALRYLRGESLPVPATGIAHAPSNVKPWVLICYGGFPLGWARLVQGRLKNQLPTSWAAMT